MRYIAIAVIGCATACLAKTGPTITIEVVNSQASQRQYSYYAPGTNSTSSTNCDTTGYGYSATTNCTTTTNPGTPGRTVTNSIAQEHVYAVMPDGSHITLWCQAGFRRCSSLGAGNYAAEIKGNNAWIVTHDLDGKEHKVKYHSVGGW
jgi:hypothetical protein